MPRDESLAARWGRRAITVPGYTALTALALLGLPVLLPTALAVDLARRRPLPTTRILAFLTFYLLCETLGLIAAFGAWLASGIWAGADPRRFRAWNHRLQHAWAGALFLGVRRIYGLAFQQKGAESVGRGPLLVFARHASVGDTILPAVLLSARQGLRLRYVIKRELLWDPCLDVVGQRLPHLFVRRDSGDRQREIEALRQVSQDLAPDEGILIYPEGTRFSPAKRARVLTRLERSGDAALLARAQKLRHVLPPRLGGPLALLEACPEADVLFLAHAGFEGTASFGELWHGALVGRRIEVMLWRVPATEIPRDRPGRIDWLYGQWERIDAWLDAVAGSTR